MVARVLVGVTVSLITRRDDPERFKENVEPYIFSQTQYARTVEDLKTLGAVQVLVCDVSFSLNFRQEMNVF